MDNIIIYIINCTILILVKNVLDTEYPLIAISIKQNSILHN